MVSLYVIRCIKSWTIIPRFESWVGCNGSSVCSTLQIAYQKGGLGLMLELASRATHGPWVACQYFGPEKSNNVH